MDTTKLLADAQQVVADIQAIVPTPSDKTVTGIAVNYSDGSTANFTPSN